MVDKKLDILQLFGHGRSHNDFSSVNASGEPVPWFVYPAFEFLECFDLSQSTVFEWGSGNSTRYWAKRCREVVSVDDKKEWSSSVSCIENVTAIHVDIDRYADCIFDYEMSDLIVIDGIRRYACAQNAVQRLKPGGMIVLDNSDWYDAACLTLSEKPHLIQIDFSGFGPINNYCWTTSVFLQRDFSMKRKQPTIPRPVGGLLTSLTRDA
tara:strand:+ start:1753 stop:2379 length:627 start_codon:yes stop_codon:yes gene_type:complete